ncbi:ABC transporter substrate-binding protein [Alicyclobacillus sp. SO9]|uniref:ABC transporter substrate-binding protein n=1 Tax=Alicyclobacillus sp. SO9 TaxID=2665646 RepID=UPI0018E82D72|nr:ABC transporter substrate-binding protein [Alicyclobacillus sp. SO9]QQE79358.1 peptide ABC transporter substrate-binding protein [Alicyclobacillus sp. SO9]
MNGKTLVTSMALLVGLGTVTACGSTTGTSGSGNSSQNSASGGGSASSAASTLKIGLDAAPPKLDPSLSTSLVSRQVMVNIFDTLVKIGPDNKLQPDLATKWHVSNGGLTYTFTLRQNVKFQDGTTFDAKAVKFNLDRDMQKISPRHSSLSAIKSVTTPNSSTVVLTLSKPFSPLLTILAGRSGMMVSPAAVKKEGSKFTNHPVGTGPFEFKTEVKGDHITLVRNPKYWGGEPKIKTVEYKIFTDPNVETTNLKSGAVQMVDTVPASELASVKSNSQLKIVNKPSLGFQGIYMNVKAKPFTNQYLREAVNLAINRQALVNVALKNAAVPGYSAFSPASPAYNKKEDTPPTPNAAKIKQLLQKGGAPSGFKFTFQTAANSVNTQIAQIIQQMLKKYGIQMSIKQLDFGTLLNNSENGNFQAMQLGWSGRVDPDQNIYSFMHTGGPLNSSQFSNKKVDQLLTQARTITSMPKRAELYAQISQIIHQQAPYAYLYHQDNIIAYSKKVQGFQYYADGLIRVANLSLS